MKTLMLILITSAVIASGIGSYVNFSTGDNAGGIICLLLVLANFFNLLTEC